MRVELFKGSQKSFLKALDEAGLPYERRALVPGVYASGTVITLLTFGIPALAAVLAAWLAPRPSRKLIVTMKDRTIVHIEGNSVQEIQALLSEAERITAIDTGPDEAD